MATQQYEPFSGKLDAAPQYEEFSGQLDGEPKKPAGAFRRVADTGLALAKGVIGVPEAAVGVADLVTKGRAGKMVEGAGVRFKDAKDVLTGWQSDEQKAADAEVAKAEGFAPTLGAMVRNPSTIANAAAESAPSMILGGAASRGLLKVAPKMGGIAAGAGGEGIVAAGQNTEQVRQEDPNGLITGKQAAILGASGLATGGISLASGKVANKLGIGDVQTMLATGKIGTVGEKAAETAAKKGIFRKVGEGALVEGVGQELPQSAQEQAAQNLAQDKPIGEGVGAAAAQGMLVGGLTGAGGAGLSALAGPDQVATDPPPAPGAPPAPAATPPATPAGLPPIDPNAIAEPGQTAPGMGYDPNGGQMVEFPDGSQSYASELPVIHPSFGPLSSAASLLAGPDGVIHAPLPALDEKMLEKPTAATKAEQAAADAGPQTPGSQGPGGMYRIADAISADGPTSEIVKVVVRPDGTGALQRDNGDVIDITNMLRAGFSVERALAQTLGDDTSGKNVSRENQGTAPAAPESAPAPRQPDILPTDIARLDGKPFQTENGARLKQREAGGIDGSDIVAVANGFVVRPKVSQPQEQALAQADQAIEIPSQRQTPARPTPDAGAAPGNVAPAVQPAADGAVVPVDDAKPNNRSLTVPQKLSVTFGGKTYPVESIEDAQRKWIKFQETADDGGPVGVSKVGNGVRITDQDGKFVARISFNGRVWDGEGDNASVIAEAPRAVPDQRLVPLSKRALVQPETKPQPAVVPDQAQSAQSPWPSDQASPAPAAPESVQNQSSPNGTPEPTTAQKEAGNYAKGHVKIHGLDVSIENPKGSTRSGKRPDGSQWSHEMSDHYGYVKRTTGADGEQVDVYVGPKPESDKVFVVDQLDQKTGAFDEAKVMMGYDNRVQAINAYRSNFDKGWKVGNVTPMTVAEFKTWLKDGDTTKPLAAVSKSSDADPAAGKWYGTQEKAAEKLAAMGLSDTHEVVRDGMRFELRKKAAAAPANPLQQKVAEAKAKKDAPAAPAIVKGEIGMKFEAGQIVTTSSGRQTTPFPKVDTTTNGKTNNTLKRVDAWLISNALAEAQSRGDTFNERQFQAVNNLNPTQSDKDSAEEYLFSEQPKVVPSILKPLVTPIPAGGTRKAAEVIDNTNTNPGEYLVRDAGTNLARFTLKDGRATAIKHFYDSQGTRDFAMEAINAFVAKQRSTQAPTTAPKKPATPQIPPPLPPEAYTPPAPKQDAAPAPAAATGESWWNSMTTWGRQEALKAAGYGAIKGAVKWDYLPEPAREKLVALIGTPADPIVKGAMEYVRKPEAPPAAPAPAPAPAPAAATDALSDQAKAAKAKMLAAAGKLAHLLSKNTRANITPEQEQAMLPIVIELFEGAMELGYVKFKQAARYVREFIASAIDQDAADSIPIDTLQGAYIATARRHKDKDITSKADVIAVESVDELTEPLETPVEKADTAPDQPQETLLGANNDTGRNATDDRQLLDDAVSQPGQQDVQGGDPAAIDGLRTPDPQADGRPADDRSGRGDSLDGDPQPVLPGTPAEIRPLADSPVGRTEERPDALTGENPGNFEITYDLRLGEGTDGQKIKANLDAIRTLRLVQKEKRFPTQQEQRIMARYVGWGGLKTVFDPNKKDATDLYGKAQRELRELLNPQEYRAANGSIRNAHYTAQGIVQGMWRVARHMGFKGGRVLEPTVGIGNFIGLQPKDMAASSQWHASELDTVTGQMAAMLYPEANVLASTGFQDAPFADDAFDLVIGNPPFGQQTIDDKNPNRKHLSGMKIHNYIIAKSGMHLRPGGVMSLVVTHRFLDTANPEARDVLAADFKFLGAFRLPNNAFAENAGTEVVTDVIFLQKLRPDEARDREASWLDVNGKITVDGQDIRVNRYYQDNPSHILGRSATDGTMYGGRTPEEGGQGEYTVHGDGRDLGQAIDNLITGGFADLAGIMERTGSDMSAAPAMLMQSDLPVGGVMLDADDKIRRRELDDDRGNAVIVEITPETLWKEQAAEWQALQTSLLDIRERAKDGRVNAADAQEFLALASFTFKSDGTKRAEPSKAEAAVYKLVDALAKPESFKWDFDNEGLQIGLALARKQLGEKGYKSLKGMLDLRNRALRLIRAEQTEDPKMEDLRQDLNTAYDAFVKANGFLSDPKNSNLLDGDIGVEAGLEATFDAAISAEVSKSTGIPARKASATKADILKQRVNFPYKEITTAATSADALSVSLSEHGKVDLPYMARITGKSILEVINDLSTGENPQLFRDPETNEFQEAERYLSGNVRHKLEVAREKNERANIKALEKVQPEPKTKSNVTPNIRGMWVPEAIFSEFLQSIGYRTPRISILASQGIMTAEGGPIAITDFGTQFRHARATPVDMFNAAVAGKPLIIYDPHPDGRVRNDAMTKEVTALVDRMAKVFQEWAYSDDRRADAVVAAFNEKMNTHVKRTYDGVKYLRQVGASPSIKLRRTQKNAAWRMIQEKTMLADHVVGAGKTFTLITGIMERRRMGLSRKPMVAVPNHLVVQWARDFYKLYPSAKVLAATPADFARKNRRRLLARIATGDYDAIIIGHSSLGFIETPAEDLRAISEEKLAGLRKTLEEARRNKDSKRTLGQIEDRIDRYETRLRELAERPTDEIGIDFKSMGIDHLSVDEAHEFKNLEYSTSGDRVKGMNDPNGSKKAFDLYSKARGLLARDGGVVFATGTPVSNSLVEIYTVMSYLAHDQLVLRNQDHFDSWSGAYAATETRLEYTSTQKLKPARVLAGLNNLSALRQLYEQFADIITMADLKRIYTEEKIEENKRNGTNLSTEFPIPRVRYGARQLNSGPVTKAQQEYMDYLVARMTVIEQQKSNRAYPAIDNPLNVLTDARKMSLDIRIVDPTAPRDENGKVMRAAKNIKAAYDASDANRGTQLVFCDLSTPAKTAAKEAKRMVTEALTLLVGEKKVKANRSRFDGLSFEKQWALLRESAERIIDDPATDEQRRDQVSTYFDAIEDAEATMLTADIGFSVYDDMRKVLMEMGIPESEIAFIHDYNTPEQKEKLFDRVNNGYIRVLMGSTMKMGAGTNAQRRMVALHHMDAPWRPSDVEQREGRIIRQGNLFATLPELIQGGVNDLYDPEFEVGIDAYSTENTSDTVMWQVLERKSGAIEQFRAGGLDSTVEEGSDSNQYAEFMASSTGNPVFRLKLEAERKVTELTADISGALITRSNAASFMQQYESRRASDVAMRDAAQAASGFTSAAYGGQSGTVADFETAMKDAEAKYMERFAEYQTRRSDAEVAIAAWELQPESTRGEKPKTPTAPSRPNLMTNTVQTNSGFARAIGLALKESKAGKQTVITLSDSAKVVIEGQVSTWKGVDSVNWEATLRMGDQKIRISFGSGDKATDSSKLVYDLTPTNIAQDIEWALRNASEQIADLDSRKAENERRAKLDIDTSKRDAAQAELRWYELQVTFAEVEADIRRSSRPNRYIARDKRRPLGQMAKVDLAATQTVEVNGEKFTTTGVQTGQGSYMNMQATRDSDGLPAVVQIRTAQGKNNETQTTVLLQPASIPFKPKPGKSTNLRQTGAPEGNDTDVVFARGTKRTTGVHMDDAEAIIAQAREALPTAPPIIPLESLAQAPADLRKFIKAAGAEADFEAAYHMGKIYVLPSNVGSTTRLQFLLTNHEIIHHGLRTMLGPRMNQVMFQIHATNANVRAAAAEQVRKGYATSKVLATEEALADMPVEDLVKLNGWDKIVAAVREWLRGAAMRLRRVGLANVADAIDAKEWTDKDVAYLIAQAKGISRGGSAKYATEGTVFGQDGDMPAFYSALTREINANTARAQPALGWASTMHGLVKAGKIKREELEWSGVLDWLKLQEGKVTRDQMVAYLDANGVRVEETVLGGGNKPPGYDADIELLSDNGLTLERNPEDPSMVAFMDENGELLSADELAEEPGLAKELVLAAYRVQEAADADKVPTRYANYQLPGGTNYREVLLTLPDSRKAADGWTFVQVKDLGPIKPWDRGNEEKWAAIDPNGDRTATFDTEAGARDYANRHGQPDKRYKSPHWDQPNVLAHIRVNDRTDADGKKVLFVEEIQSDWGQDGKKKGFAATDTTGWTAKVGSRGATADLYRVYDANGNALNGSPIASSEAEAIEKQRAMMDDGKTPAAPFVTKTDAWLRLALKRIVKMAADGGYDRVAFVNGEQSADRYRMSNTVREIEVVSRTDMRTGEKSRSVSLDMLDGKFVRLGVSKAGIVDNVNGDLPGSNVMGKPLADVVGKDLAEKLMEAPSGTKINGEGLNVGGSGMKAFYDTIVPNTLKDVLKKVGGGALETVDVGSQRFVSGSLTQYETYPASRNEAMDEIDRTGNADSLRVRFSGDTDDVPSYDVVNFYASDYDAGRIGEGYINALENRGADSFYIEREVKSQPQPGFTVTPAMREKASGGLPMFDRAAYTPSNGQQQSTADLTPAAQGNIDKLNSAITRFLGASGTATRPFQARRLRDHAGLQGLGDAFGATIQGFRVDPSLRADVAREFDFFNGVYTSGAIYLNENSQRPHLAILGHELAHQLAKTNYVLYRQLVNAIEPFIDKAKYPAFAKTSVGREHANNPDKLREEFVGEVLSDGFMNRDFWRAVGKSNPSLLQRIVRMVGELLNKALAKMGYTNRTEQYLTDFKQVMQVAGEVMGEYGLKVPTEAIGGLSFNKEGQTDTPAFRKWFGDSKVVDADGNPLVVYHGTHRDFATFDAKAPSSHIPLPGFYFTPHPDIASTFAESGAKMAENKAGRPFEPTGAAVMPAYLSIKNPLDFDASDGVMKGFVSEKIIKEIILDARRKGHDGVIIRGWKDGSGPVQYVAFNPNQIKSATGNRGTFDNTNPDIRFNTKESAQTLRSVTDRLMEATRPIGTVSLWDKTVGTQYNKSTKDADFKRVFDGFYQQTDDTAHYAIEAERHAPDVLMRLDNLGDVWKGLVNSGSKQKADLAAVSKALFANIEGEEGIKQVEYNDQNLRELFKLTPRQIEMYRQVRKSVNTSIERLAQTYAAQFGQEQGMDIAQLKDMDLADTVGAVKRKIGDDLDETLAKIKLRASVAAEDKAMTPAQEKASNAALAAAVQAAQQKAGALLERLDKMQEHADFLQENAYMPALRFGEYAVTVTQEGADDKPETLHFEMFESQTAANLAAMRLRKEYPGADVVKSVLNKEQYAMFKGVSPETVSLFAKFTGIDKNEAVQNYIALAKSSRSVLMRQIKRKGIAGFSQDATRVLSSFVTSNARQSAININQGAITDALASKALARKGDVQLEAQKLAQYMNNPLEEARRLRGFMFAHFMGGSVASALVNMTQPVMQTAPYLSQFAGGKTTSIMLSSARMAASGRIENAELRSAAKRAADEGITEPHEIHQLMADATGSALGNSLRSRAAVKAWGSFFSLAEAYNRRVTFIAAYQVAQLTNKPDPFEFARIAVIETQGLYGKVNRPNWARGAVGATLFTFKQFSIAYIEFLRRLPPKQKALALGILVLAAGLQGLPFADDIEDIIDTIGQSLGYNTNSKKALRQFLVDNLGEDLGAIVDSGIFTQTSVDVQGRLGMGNLLPGTAIFKPSETNKAQTMAEIAGPLGGVLMAAQKALGAAQRGDMIGAVQEMTPVAGKNFLKGLDMLNSGVYKDTRGYKVADVTAVESFMKMLGLQPGTIAEKSRRMSEQWQDKSMVTMMESMIADQWAKGVFDKEPDQVAKARATLTEWNERNPGSRIQIGFPQIRRRVQQMAQTREQRFIKTVPKELRAGVARELAQ